MRRVIIISDFTYPNYVGGSAKLVYDTLVGFSKNNIDYLLITRTSSNEYSVKEHNDFYLSEKKRNKIFEINNLLDIIRSYKFIKNDDILYIHHPVLGVFYSFLKNKKIYFFHGPFPEEYRLKPNSNSLGLFLRYLIQKIVLKKNNKIFVLSNYMKEWVNKYGGKNIEIVPPIFDYEKFASFSAVDKFELRRQLNLPVDKKILITTRRLTDRTGVLELLEAFEYINLHYKSDYFLIIIGKGELEAKVKQKCSNIKNARFLGYVQEDLLPKYLRASDVYILPSKSLEGFGIVILEAMALNIPVIASNKSGGATEFLSTIDAKLIFDFDNMARSLNESIKYLESVNIDFSSIARSYDRNVVAKIIYEKMNEC